MLPSQENAGSIDLSNPVLLEAIQLAPTTPNAVGPRTPVFLRSVVDYNYCSNNYGSAYGGASGTTCQQPQPADVRLTLIARSWPRLSVTS